MTTKQRWQGGFGMRSATRWHRLPTVEITAPCGFQHTFLECSPGHTVVVKRCVGLTYGKAMQRAWRWLEK